MEHLRELKEEVEIVAEEEHHVAHALSDPSPQTRDDSIQGRGRGRGNEAPTMETWGLISASLGAMRPLVAKLDNLLLAHPAEGMRLLSDDVKKISSYVDELSEVEDPSRTAKCWMNEARGLSYDMEDYIDSLLFVQPAVPSLVAKDMEADEPIAAMVSEFSKSIQQAIKRHKSYVVQDSGARSALRRRFVSLGPMLPTSYEDIIIDRRMKEFIKSFAEDGDEQVKVVSLVGSACLGKTTLATVLYSILGKRYHCRAFIRVSRKPDTKRIFRDMLWQLRRQDPPEYRYEVDLIDNIKNYLRNKRYLIIIDDLWAASVWDTINDALPKGSHGSRIVTTTQIQDVALTCCCHQPKLVFEMKPLDEDHSRELFFNRLFGSESGCPEIFKEVSNEIVEMCGGLPLATISIASLLASQPVITEDLLEHIRDSLSSCFSASERTRQALNLSFNNLPYYLKTCLLCLGMYPQGYTICTNDLVKQWMAEGFIETRQGQDAEEVAESYLHQLIGRRFIQPIHINYNNEVLSCAVLDTVHDLIAHKSAEDNFNVAIDYSQKNVALSRKARRLSLLFGDARYAKAPANITKSQVRSLIYFGLVKRMRFITKYKLLRVLVLQISGHGGEDNPVDLTGISDLIQLRYLKIGCGLCVKLPTDGLKCLETLDITDAFVIGSSRGIILPHLLHLSLPSEGGAMHWNGIRWILGEAGRLDTQKDLEGNDSDLITLIKGHGNLRTVAFSHGSTVKNKVVRSGAVTVITSKEMITSGAPLLQRFECSLASGITFIRIPKWVKYLENLCILKIAVRILEMDCVGILRGLRALTALSLRVRRETAQRIIFRKAEFSALKYFNLRFTTGIAWIKFDKDTMPNLWRLKLVFKAIPRMEGNLFFVSTHAGRYEQYKHGNALIVIEHMPSLTEISAKFEGATADLERIKGMGISIGPSINPAIVSMQFVDSSSYGDQSTKLAEEKDPAGETLDRAAAEKSQESLLVFTLDELISATNNFSMAHLEGDKSTKRNLDRTFCRPGAYAGSFKGNLRPCVKPQPVVVKCLNMFSDDHEWMMVDQTELEYLCTVRHPNLVKLLGLCDYNEHRMLVYEYMPTKCLKQYICGDFGGSFETSKNSVLAWSTRLKIAVGAAKGLAFLHKADKPMAHGDFKASKVLITSDHIAKLIGYRLAEENSRDKTTPGNLRAESDVYNFGVVLLELLAGRQAVRDPQIGLSRLVVYLENIELVAERDMLEGLRPYLYREDKLHLIIDPGLKGQYSWQAAWTTATIVRRCLHSVPQKRPSMHVVVEALEPLLLLVDAKPSSQTKNADKEAGSSNRSKTIQLDVKWKDSSCYPPEWRGRHKFTLRELMFATSNFSDKNLLGEADFGHIYKGVIDGKLMVALMKLRPDYDDWLVPSSWLPELQQLESMSEPHLVRLLGYSDQDEQCVLVYEYMPRGSLSDNNHLASIPWLTRLEIAVGAAKGLTFLHESGKQTIYYTGFTASSILLASDYTAKLWGFGLAKQGDVRMRARMRTDVYNYGVVLLELLVGRGAMEKKQVLDPEMNLVKWVEQQFPDLRGFFMMRHDPYKPRENELPNILDLEKYLEGPLMFGKYSLNKKRHPSLQEPYPVRAELILATIAWQCLQRVPEDRPFMRDVVDALVPLLVLETV